MAVLALALLLVGTVLTSAHQVSVRRLLASVRGWPPRQQVCEGLQTLANVDAPTAACVRSAWTPHTHTHAFTLLHKKCKNADVCVAFDKRRAPLQDISDSRL